MLSLSVVSSVSLIDKIACTASRVDVTIRMRPNGPLLIEGPFTLVDAGGTVRRCSRGENAEPRMQQEADGEEHRHPGKIDNGNRPGAGQKGADLVEVAQRLRDAGVEPITLRHREVEAQ